MSWCIREKESQPILKNFLHGGFRGAHMHRNREHVYVRFRSIKRSFAMLAIAVSLAGFPVLLAARAASQNDPAALSPLHNAALLGTAWYPEQWPESRWEEDLRLMEAAHITFTRVAEFAWSRMEPLEGEYDFDWLERAISAAGKHNITGGVGEGRARPPPRLP